MIKTTIGGGMADISSANVYQSAAVRLVGQSGGLPVYERTGKVIFDEGDAAITPHVAEDSHIGWLRPARPTRCLSQYDDRTGECNCDFCRQERYDEHLEWLDEQDRLREDDSFGFDNEWADDFDKAMAALD